MKKITGIVIILVALLLGSYYGMGFITERTVKNNLAVVNHSNGLYAEVVSYQRGWFQSKALLDWSIHVPARTISNANGQVESIAAQDYRVEMPLTIYHGPIIYSDHGMMFGLGYAHTDLSLPQKVVDQFNTYFTKDSMQPTMNISLFVDYLNNSQINIRVPQFNLVAKQGKMMFEWMGMNSSVKTTSSLSDVNGHFEVEGITYNQDQMTATLGEITGKYNLHKTDAGLFYGQASTMVPSVQIKNNNEKMLELSDFVIDTSTNIDNNLFSSSLNTSMNKLSLNGRVFGPGQLSLAIKNLDATVLAEINNEVSKAQQGTDLEKQQAMLSILPQLPKLFSQGPVFEISKMSLVVPEGAVNGTLSISLPSGSIGNPFELIQKIQGNGKLSVPAILMKEMVTQSIKQRLMSNALDASQPATATPATDASSAATTTPTAPQSADVKAAAPAAASTTSTTATAPTDTSTATTSAANLSLDDVTKEAVAGTDKEIASMLESGLLVVQGSDYAISIQLNQGQFVINGKPFNPAMLKF